MKVIENEDLSKHTTIHIGGVAKRYLIPETREELIEIATKEKSPRYIGGGSNILVNNRDFDTVVQLSFFDKKIENLGAGMYRVGASVRLQKLINAANNDGFGGLEYLFSVPGLVGGAIVMNAGRRRNYGNCISDFIVSVEALKDGEIIVLRKDECNFTYRNSIFKNSDYVVLSAVFQFPRKSMEDSAREKQERLEFCKKTHDNSKPNFGTVFSTSNRKIMEIAKKMRLGNKKIHFSAKTANWIINEQQGTYNDAIKAIKRVEFLHKFFHEKCEREVIVWE